jgi:hypothetical protein
MGGAMGGAMVGLLRLYYAHATHRRICSNHGTRQGLVKGAKVACIFRNPLRLVWIAWGSRKAVLSSSRAVGDRLSISGMKKAPFPP